MIEGQPPPPPDMIPQWLKDARQEETTPSSEGRIPDEIIRDELPTSEIGLIVKNHNGRTMWLTSSISMEYENCNHCKQDIDIGTGHIYARIQHTDPEGGNHHLHQDCAYVWCDFELGFDTFQDTQEANRKISKARRKYRNRHN